MGIVNVKRILLPLLLLSRWLNHVKNGSICNNGPGLDADADKVPDLHFAKKINDGGKTDKVQSHYEIAKKKLSR